MGFTGIAIQKILLQGQTQCTFSSSCPSRGYSARKEFDEEDGMIRVVQSPNLQVMGIDIWYDSDEEAKESTNVQEYDDSEIIIQNKGNNAKAAS